MYNRVQIKHLLLLLLLLLADTVLAGRLLENTTCADIVTNPTVYWCIEFDLFISYTVQEHSWF